MLDHYLILLSIMLFMHIIAEYFPLNTLKKLCDKIWWTANYPNKLSQNEWYIAIFIYSYFWAFMIQIPVLYQLWGIITVKFVLILICNTIIRAVVKNFEINTEKIGSNFCSIDKYCTSYCNLHNLR